MFIQRNGIHSWWIALTVRIFLVMLVLVLTQFVTIFTVVLAANAFMFVVPMLLFGMFADWATSTKQRKSRSLGELTYVRIAKMISRMIELSPSARVAKAILLILIGVWIIFTIAGILDSWATTTVKPIIFSLALVAFMFYWVAVIYSTFFPVRVPLPITKTYSPDMDVKGLPEVFHKTKDSASLRWEKVSKGVSYVVKYSKKSVEKSTDTDAAYEFRSPLIKDNIYTVRGLEPWTVYYFSVVGLSSSGVESEYYSEEVSVDLPKE